MTKLIVGLGNPGREYAESRHNIGFQFVDFFVNLHHLKLEHKNWSGSAYHWVDKNVDCWLLKPSTFVNLSGKAVSQAVQELHIDVRDILVVYDEVDLELGHCRFKQNGGSGGHNGLKSISDAVQTEDYFRLRIGVGPRPPGDLSEFVLKSFSNVEKDAIFPHFPYLCEGVLGWLVHGPIQAMNQFNRPAGDDVWRH